MNRARSVVGCIMLFTLLGGCFSGKIGEDIGGIIGLTVGLTLLSQRVI